MDELETRARALLEAAGETITVGPPSAMPVVRRRVWPIAAVAAATGLLVLGVAVVLGDDGGSARPTGPGSELRVPQTELMTREQARATLVDLGLRVETAGGSADGEESECGYPEGRVAWSDPPPTTVVSAGTTVTLAIAGVAGGPDESSRSCPAPRRFEDAVALLDLARFGENGPEFAESVQVWVDGELTRTLTAGEAADADAWGESSPLTRMVAALDWIVRFNGRLDSPEVWTMVDRGGQYACGATDPPAALAGRESTVVTIGHPSDGGPIGQCHWVRLYRNAEGQVDAVASADLPWPADQRPTIEPDGPPEPTAEQRAVARAFLGFAGGGPAPAFASDVEVLLGNTPSVTLDAASAADPDSWSLPCDGYAERACPIDLFAYTSEEGSAVFGTEPRDDSSCHTTRGELPSDLAAPESLTSSVSLGEAEPAQCRDNWEIQLWLDDDAQIRAVNLILGSP